MSVFNELIILSTVYKFHSPMELAILVGVRNGAGSPGSKFGAQQSLSILDLICLE